MMFKWVCLSLATIVAVVLLLIVNDLRMEIKRSAVSVNEHLPAILEKSKTTTETLAKLSGDVKQLRDLAGVGDKARDESLAIYADNVLDFIRDSGGQIGLKKKLFGSGLKELVPASEWVAGARREALYLALMRAKSKQEIFNNLSDNVFGSDWYIQFAGQEPQPLRDWLAANHPETKALIAETK